MTQGDARVRFEPSGRDVTVPHGSTLLAAARMADVAIDAPCDGAGTCGSCRVHAEGALSPLRSDERELLGGAGVTAGVRLACRARALGDVTVTVREVARDARVLTHTSGVVLQVEPPSARGIDVLGPALGAAIDVGTTTLAVQVVDLRTGDVLASAGGLSAQRAHGADVMSRIAHATAGQADELHRLAVNQIDGLLTDALTVAGYGADALVEVALVGNTAMRGLVLGLDVTPLGAAPYVGADLSAIRTNAPAVGLDRFASAEVYALPAIGPFVGADVTAGLVATRLAGARHPTLFIDLGTNGEIVLSAHGTLTATSTAAGPAFEGAEISCGMRAVAGAIERVDRAGDGLSFGVIGEREPAGVCGSGLVDLVATLLDAGVIEPDGRFASHAPGVFDAHLTERDGVREFRLDRAGDLALTQKDVRQVQLAVGAVRAGVEVLLATAGVSRDSVAEVIVAGGFGHHLRPSSLARLGLIDAAWADRVRVAGNAALAGARMALVDSAVRREAEALARRVSAVDLAQDPRFNERFLAALAFPA